jgi:MFS family permease
VAPIAVLTEEAFGHVNAEQLVVVFLGANAIATACEPIILSRLGLRRTILFGALLLMIGNIIKSGGMPPIIQAKLTKGEGEWRVYLGFFLVGLSQPLYQCTPALLSASWFPENERTMATGVALNANQLGIGFAFIFGTLLVESSSDIPTYFGLLSIISTITFLGTLIQFDDAPPTPPSETAKVVRGTLEAKLPSVQSIFQSVRKLGGSTDKTTVAETVTEKDNTDSSAGAHSAKLTSKSKSKKLKESPRDHEKSKSKSKEEKTSSRRTLRSSNRRRSNSTGNVTQRSPLPVRGPVDTSFHSLAAPHAPAPSPMMPGSVRALVSAPSPMMPGPVRPMMDSNDSETDESRQLLDYHASAMPYAGYPVMPMQQQQQMYPDYPMYQMPYGMPPYAYAAAPPPPPPMYPAPYGADPRMPYYPSYQQGYPPYPPTANPYMYNPYAPPPSVPYHMRYYTSPDDVLPYAEGIDDGVEPVLMITPHHLDINIRDDQILLSIRACMARPGFIHALVSFTVSGIVINTLSTFMDYLVRLNGAGREYTGVVGGSFQFVIMISSLIIGSFTDKTRAYYSVTVGMLVLGAFGLAECGVSLDAGRGSTLRWALIVVAMLVGPLQPVSTELGVDVAYPLSENTVLVIQQLFSNLLSALFIPCFKALRDIGIDSNMDGNERPQYTFSFYLLILLHAAATVFFATFNGRYLRFEHELEKEERKKRDVKGAFHPFTVPGRHPYMHNALPNAVM